MQALLDSLQNFLVAGWSVIVELFQLITAFAPLPLRESAAIRVRVGHRTEHAIPAAHSGVEKDRASVPDASLSKVIPTPASPRNRLGCRAREASPEGQSPCFA